MPVDIENECRSLRKKVREKAEWEQERQQQEDMQRRRREHPEEYCTLKEIVDEVTKKRGEANSSDIAAETQATVA